MEEDDFINIRPPQAKSEDKSHRPRISSSKRDRQVFVSSGRRGDERSQNRQNRHSGQSDSHRQRAGLDLRDRLNNRNQGGGSRHRPKDNRNRGDHKRGDSRRGPPHSGGLAQGASRSSHKDGGADSRDRDERDLRLQRMMTATQTKAESKRDIEAKREKRKLLERQAQEAENRVKRKRDNSRDRKDSSKGKDSDKKSEGEDDSESGEEEEDSDEESESGEDSADTASEQSGATPEHNEGSNSEGNEGGEEVEEEDEEEDSVASDTESGSEKELEKLGNKVLPKKSSKFEDRDSDQSRSPSKSPTPRRAASDQDEGSSPMSAEDTHDSERIGGQIENEGPGANLAAAQVQRDFRDDLPTYLPSIYGCRSVEEFQCLNRIEEGTYGVVYRARDKKTNETVALKRLKMEREKEGFPITSLREINTLLISQHRNVVHVREIVVGSNMDKIFIVMDFVEHDMKALMETMRQKNQVFLPGEVKCLMEQLLNAIAHLHDNWILHRDLKTSNLLLSHHGILKVGDFGLAREYGSPLKPYTAVVVTLWYRAPELLLGIKEYSTYIDVWSIGVIFGEFLLMNALFPGKSESEELDKIFKLLGTPSEKIWPGFNSLPLVQKMKKFVDYPISRMRDKFPKEMLSEKGIELLRKFLTYDPKQRISCEGALHHSYFEESPLAIDPSMFPTWPAKSEQGPGSTGRKAASPKPPSGGGAFKKMKDDDDDVKYGFQLNAAAGWNLKF